MSPNFRFFPYHTCFGKLKDELINQDYNSCTFLYYRKAASLQYSEREYSVFPRKHSTSVFTKKIIESNLPD